MERHGSGCLTAMAVVLGIVLVALGAGLLWLVSSGGAPVPATIASGGDEVEPRSFSEYSWEELAEVAQLVAAAPSDEEGDALAEEYGVGVGATRPLALDDGRQATLTVVGVRADERADGSGVAGLTLMASPIAVRPMNSIDTNAGGWEASELRAWLDTEGSALLPDALADAVVAVSKSTNNVGVSSDAAAVTQTSDRLWLFSASEVCGAPGWFAQEYGEEPNAYTGYVDFSVYDDILAAEGEQYAYFADAGVSGSSDPGHVLALDWAGADVAWWYRTSYPYSFTGEDASYFYQVMASGYPSTTALASTEAGVTVGLCL